MGNIRPYSGYLTSNTLINALRPFPQFSTTAVTNSPTGKTYYDSMQVKGTKRMTHGLQVNGTFTWSKALVLTREDFFNPVSLQAYPEHGEEQTLPERLAQMKEVWAR